MYVTKQHNNFCHSLKNARISATHASINIHLKQNRGLAACDLPAKFAYSISYDRLEYRKESRRRPLADQSIGPRAGPCGAPPYRRIIRYIFIGRHSDGPHTPLTHKAPSSAVHALAMTGIQIKVDHSRFRARRRLERDLAIKFRVYCTIRVSRIMGEEHMASKWPRPVKMLISGLIARRILIVWLPCEFRDHQQIGQLSAFWSSGKGIPCG